MESLSLEECMLADALFAVGAVKLEGYFRLKLHEKNPDAPESPIYLNLRTADHPKNPGPLVPEIMAMIGDLFRVKMGRDFDCYADLPDAGMPFGDQWARVTSHSARRLTLHKVVNDDGTRRITEQVDGAFERGMSCLLVDDLITQADTKLEGIAALTSAGLIVEDVLVVVDRQQGGEQQLNDAGIRLHALFQLTKLLHYYQESGKITKAKYDEIIAYLLENGGRF